MMWFSMFFYWDSFLHSLPFSKAISSVCYLLHVVRHHSRVLYSPTNVPQLERNRTAIIVILLPQTSRMNAIGACRQEIMIMLPVFLQECIIILSDKQVSVIENHLISNK